MSVATHLESTASALIVRKEEDDSISRSITTLSGRLSAHFGDAVKERIQFGSSTRGTMLPRKADESSDVDYMVVFDNSGGLKPESMLARLRTFVEQRYASSERFQAHPTVVLNLNHIKFELVPAYRSWGTLHIPAPSKSFAEWMSTDPVGFNTLIDEKNKNNQYMIKPLIRLLKYWNARCGYIYNSYEFEQWVVGLWFSTAPSLKEYLYQAVELMPETYGFAQWRLDRIRRAKEIVKQTKHYERNTMPSTAETEIKKLLPVL